MSDKIFTKDVIRYRAGRTALMRVDYIDEDCGYPVYHGTHIYGESIIIPASDRCRKANDDEERFYLYCRGIRTEYPNH